MGLDKGPNILGYRLQMEGDSVFTSAFGKARHAVVDTSASLGQLDRGVQSVSRSWAEGALKLAGTVGGLMAANAVVTKGWNAAVADAQALRRVTTLLEPGQKAAQLFGDEFDRIARRVGIDDAILLNAGYDALQKNISKTDLAAFIEESARTAGATTQDLGAIITATTNAMSVYGYTVTEAHRVQNLLFQGVRHGASDIGVLGELIGQQGYQAKTLGLELEDLVAALGALGAGGVRGSRAMMGLSTILTAMQDPGEEALQQAQFLGIAWDTASIKAMGFGKWLQHVQERLKAGEAWGQDPSRALKALGLGAMTGNTFSALMANADSYNQILDEIRRGEDVTGKLWTQWQADPIMRTQQLGTATGQLWDRFGGGMMMGLSGIGGAEELDRVVERLGPQIESLGENLGNVLKSLAEFAIEYLPPMMSVVKAVLDQNKKIKEETGVDPAEVLVKTKLADEATGGLLSGVVSAIGGAVAGALASRWLSGGGRALSAAGDVTAKVLPAVGGPSGGITQFGDLSRLFGSWGHLADGAAGIELPQVVSASKWAGLGKWLGGASKALSLASLPALAGDIAMMDKTWANINRPEPGPYSTTTSWIPVPGMPMSPDINSQMAYTMMRYFTTLEEALIGQSIPHAQDAIDKAFSAYADAFGSGLGDTLANRIQALLGRIEDAAQMKKDDELLLKIDIDHRVEKKAPWDTDEHTAQATTRMRKAGAGRAETHANYRFFTMTPGTGVHAVKPLPENVMLSHIRPVD